MAKSLRGFLDKEDRIWIAKKSAEEARDTEGKSVDLPHASRLMPFPSISSPLLANRLKRFQELARDRSILDSFRSECLQLKEFMAG
jgi:hypothetical protein